MKKFFFALALSLVTSAAFAIQPFELPQMNANQVGAPFRSSNYANGVFVIEPYFLGCYYCNENAPQVDDLAAHFSGQSRVHVLDVGIDRQDSDYATWINRHHPNHPVLKDASRVLIRELATTGFPSTYVVDCKGNVTYQTSGTWEGSTKDQIQDAVDKLLQQDCSAN